MNFIKSSAFFLVFFACASSQANVNDHFKQISNDPNALYAFFKIMPKGGELHYHLAGGSYPETMLALAAQDNYCFDKATLAATKMTGHCDSITIKDLLLQPTLYAQTIKDWSMKDFIPGAESGHDHFFKGFSKYIPIVFNFRPQLVADVIKRAAEQEEQYLELLDIPDNGRSLSFGDLITNSKSFAEKKQLLLANKEFQNNINQAVAEIDQTQALARQELGCKSNPQAKSCQVKIKFLYYVLREQTLDKVFAQALSAFEAVSRSKGNLVGVNLVQPEDGIISLHDYHQQMQIFGYLHQIYPKVPIALHAGELTLDSATPEDLSSHIRDALLTGQAQRIGHGVDISYENQAEDTLNYMAKQHIPVEINLISNLKILNLSGRAHPLNYYLAHHVPVVLSTDDEGVLRTDLTKQYVEAVLAQGLDYQTLKQINRNTLTYAFVPGKSIWINADKAEIVAECQDLNSKTCQQFVHDSEKAQLQWNLEQKLITFENKYK